MPPTARLADPCRLGAGELADHIAAGELLAKDVVGAYIARIQSTHPRLNAVTQPRFDEALAEADLADGLARSGEPLGPLHGVPVTIKECFAVRGLRTTLGVQGLGEAVDRDDAPLVARLRAAGAIILGKTNVPQGMLLHECDNPVFGRTAHPTHEGRSPGGSSGGEAAVVAAGGSPLGLGSDLGGSIRQPAASCGLFGLKPTSGRLSIVGSKRAIPGMRALCIQPGPLARSAADIDLAMRVLLDTSSVPGQPDERLETWPDYWLVDHAKLRVAYWTDDGLARPATAIARAVEASADSLRSLGADVRRVEAPDVDDMMRIYLRIMSADGMRNLARLVRGRPTDWQIRRQARLGRIPRWVRPALAVACRAAGQPMLAKGVKWTGPSSADTYWQLAVEADQYRERFWRRLDAAFDGQAVDAVLTPPHALPALRIDTALHLLPAASHCFLANLLDAPAGVVPAGWVSDDEEQEELAARPKGWALYDRLARRNAQGSAGLPVGVQVAARPWRDDVVLAVMAALDPHHAPA